MAPLRVSTEVARPPEEVFAYVSDPSRFEEWQQGVISGPMEGEAPHRVGEKCLTTRRIGFAERAATAEVSHVDPPRTWSIRGVDGPIRAAVTVTVDPLDDRRSAKGDRARMQPRRARDHADFHADGEALVLTEQAAVGCIEGNRNGGDGAGLNGLGPAPDHGPPHLRNGKVARLAFYWDRDRAFTDLGLTPERGS
ncbi:MAG: SRPBCC family protein [Solirubrobacteraceae bacterium]